MFVNSSGVIMALEFHNFFIIVPILFSSSNIASTKPLPCSSIIPAEYSPIAVTIASLNNSSPFKLGYLSFTLASIACPSKLDCSSSFNLLNNGLFLIKIAVTHG